MNSTILPLGTRLSQLLDDAFFRAPAGESNEWTGTHANLVELEGAYEISLDLPGVKPEEVSVEYEDGTLRISGERKFEHDEQGKKFHRVERRYGKFQRAFSLPGDVDSEKIAARFELGVLRVEVPKNAAAVPRKIEVQ